ncbi:MAG: glycoside hydrolase family 88 protein [Dysgonamonadaceae bacterium]|nr:glycoside hydrolase family 88 protein [Dysgonamonadaceae bacterium]
MRKKYINIVFLLLAARIAVGQPPRRGAGDYIESMSYNKNERNVERVLQYSPEGEDFVCINGKNRFTRALYGSHTAFRIETSDRPVFAAYDKNDSKNISFKITTGVEFLALDSADYCLSRYKAGRRDYELKDPAWGKGVLQISVLAFFDREGAIWKIDASRMPENARLRCSISEVKAGKLNRNGDMGADPPDCFEAPEHPKSLKSFDISLNRQTVYLVLENHDLLQTNEAEGYNLYNQTESARLQLASRIRFKTPDPYVNTLGGTIVMAADAIWDGEVWLHGAVGWRMPLTGWRAAYAGDFLGWHDRARIHFDAYAQSQVTDVPNTILHPAQDSALHLSRALKQWGTPMYSNGYIGRNPHRNDQMHHYNMNLAYIDELLWHFNWTGDMDYVRKMFPTLKLHLEWEKRNFDPDNDGLYDAYACIWASDALQYSSGGVTYSSAYNYRANQLTAEIAAKIGENPEPFRAEAEKILKAVNNRLWLKNKGWWAEFQDFMGNKLVHPSAGVWTVYHAIDSKIHTPFQSYQATRYIDREIPHIPVTAKGLDDKNYRNNHNKGYQTISTTNWLPYSWSVNNVAFAEVAHTSLAYWQAGRANEAFLLFKSSVLDGMYLGNSPGNIGQISFYDAARGECYRDFGDPVGVYSRALVQGLFGISPDAMNDRLVIRPGFPSDWEFASMVSPDIDFNFKRTGTKDIYTIDSKFTKQLNLELQVNASKEDIELLTVNGKPAQWSFAENVGAPLINIVCGKAVKYEVTIAWKKAGLQKPVWRPSGFQNEEWNLTSVAKITEVYDPQQVLKSSQSDENHLSGILAGESGYRTLFVQLEQGRMKWWQPIDIEIKKQKNNRLELPNINEQGKVFETVNMDNYFNATVSQIFKNEYLTPRSPYTTMQIPVQGVGEWCHPLLTADIDDSGLRKAVKNGVFGTPFGVPFRTTETGNNIAFTTLWDNYPEKIQIPLSGKALHAWFLLAGTTNHIQCHITNGIVTVYYKDGSSDFLELINPETWAPIEQDFYIDGQAFRVFRPRPYRLAFKTGIVSCDMETAAKIKPDEVYGRYIDGGAGIILDIPLKPEKELDRVEVKTIANEVVVGLMGVTLQRSATSAKTAILFAESEMKRFPEAWQSDYGKRLYFGYSQGLICLAMLKMWKQTGDRKYLDYVVEWADSLISEKGEIHLYKMESYNIDYINSGKVLFDVYRETGNEKYKLAINKLVSQMKVHPRTSEGVFWHKLIYRHQIWLDGLYMGSPFLAEYAVTFNHPEWIDDVVNQFIICAKYTYDSRTGLYYHAWDESREQRWADKTTGQSPNFWGRSIGWWMMALVDVLDFVPMDHPQRPELLKILNGLAETLPKYQDKTGLWYQIVDKGNKKGNYLEASVSSMFMYAFAKAVNKGYIDVKYRKIAENVYDGLMKNLIVENADGTLTLTRCCAVAGLGGNPYRDGSFDYYINEQVRDNDAKATGPFIMGCLELGK